MKHAPLFYENAMQSLRLNLNPKLGNSKSSTNLVEDSLARESDVTVSTNITLYAEYKGFFIYVLSALALGCWIGWTLIPEKVLTDYLSVHYYPDKYWSFAIPSFSLILMVYIYLALALYNTEVKTLENDDIRNFVDEFTTLPSTFEDDKAAQVNESIDYLYKAPSGVWDLPVTLVNDVLYNDSHLDEE
ncbi:PIG-P-domain-containing protein [Hyphopichia burtonii NRRL Y-1933]|uniref:PIG-P-domain-containing protein n=1 Tax=Hyphopichia burtonii NRRL Y-1933 TaxID=984485 RepID=A0A1E4RJM0_9ASCO|nr:PIG-P-domain-containing protein [Hyphopichia burtonii NRRL Y-1933]ODV67474.1 PIG-P-domain-containing protein [Hyphopichia burtonii NRRL Y-1933]